MPRTSRRPLTARSVIASTLLGVDPPQLPALALVRSGELFGLSEGATRTALSRMASDGEVVAEGRDYRLAGRLLARHGRQQDARRREPGPWDGTWLLLAVAPVRRSAIDRSAFRDAARTMHLAEVREGLWARPDNLELRSYNAEAYETASAQGMWIRDARPDDPDALVESFGTSEWATDARALIDEMAEWQEALDRQDTSVLAETFVIDAAVIRHLVADPRLPDELLPGSWPGSDLRNAHEAFDRGVKETLRHWQRTFRASARV